MRVEWRAALDQLRSEIGTDPAVASAFTFSGQRRPPAFDPRTTPALIQLNAVTSPIFAGIGRSPVPVLLPFDTAAFLAARLSGAPDSLSLSRYQGGNSGYPWQDNFCEARSFEVGQCASGFGHQGQDIRSACSPHHEGADRCDPYRQAVVAVRDGVLIRSPRQQAATLQINTSSEHIRFRYMHMNPKSMDADGVLNGRHVAEGEQIGVVSNYLDPPNGTSRHLHFDVQPFTRDGCQSLRHVDLGL